MKILLQSPVALSIVLSCCFFFPGYSQQNPDLQQQAILLYKVLEKNHYSPPPLDDKLSKQVFTRFIQVLDPQRLYFTATDFDQLSVFNSQLDEELKGKSWKYLPLASTLFKRRLLDAEKIVNETMQKPFNFSANETITFGSKDSLHFAANEKELGQRWNKWLKYQTLSQIVNFQEEANAAETDKSSAVLPNEQAMRQKVLLLEKRKIRRILEHPSGFENYVASLFFNAITYCYDPHTNFLSKTDLQNYEAGMSKEAFSFGIDLDENVTGDIVIDRLIPGGPAWKSNELHKGDKLIKLQWKGKESIDLSGADLTEVENLISSSNEDRMELTVRTVNGLVKTVSLVKEKIRADENIVKSFILNGEKKIGYISLPGFYTEWENMTALGCANDVAKEIVKLKAAGIDGIILDIRYNGGGSLMEGLSLAGIFINEGPLCVMQGRERKPYALKDMNRGTIYDGPLVLMVNSQSASASEILASTLQDYNRALIVGSTTYGKATGQIVMPLDTTNRPPSQRTKDKSLMGFSTVTVEKLYRITGKSAQLKGVQPDIYLPDIYEKLPYRESIYTFALSSDSVNKKLVYAALKSLPVKELAQKSNSRIAEDPFFTLVKKVDEFPGGSVKKENKTIPLTPAYFKNLATERRLWWESYGKATVRETDLFTVENTDYDKELMRIDAYSKEINELTMDNLQSDVYIMETFQILKDLISLFK